MPRDEEAQLVNFNEALDEIYSMGSLVKHLEHTRTQVLVWDEWVPYCADCSVLLRNA